MATTSLSDCLEQAIINRTAKLGVIGLGYVGLPLARALTAAGFDTLGFDVDEARVAMLLSGRSYVDEVPSNWVQESVSDGSFLPSADIQEFCEADVLLICVPTPLTSSRDPDLSFVESTARQIAATLRPGQLIVLESTTYPGTTRDVVLPILETSGLRLGQDFFLAYSPERADPGNRAFATANIPKVVGGADEASLRLAGLLYSAAVVEVVPVSSCEVAEACKILENTYRAVNIALVNELKVLFDSMGIDVWEVITAASTKPFGFQTFYPGPGWGGHCIPIDPFYLSWIARQYGTSTRFIELAGEINVGIPRWVLMKLSDALNEHGKAIRGSRIGILGVAYKPDIGDTRESPAFELMELLEQRGAIVSYNDPHVPELTSVRGRQIPSLSSEPLTTEYLEAQDCILVVTDHSAYDFDYIVDFAKLVVDTRNATRDVRSHRERIFKA